MPTLTPDQLALRRMGIGSSESAQAIGLDPREGRTPYRLWQEKRGLIEHPEADDDEAAQLGHDIEPVAVRIWERKTGLHADPVRETLIHPEYPWLLATPDARAIAQPVLIEAKNLHFSQLKRFGEEGSDDVPDYILIQCLHQLAVTHPLWRIERVDISALIGGQHHGIWTVRYSQDATARLLDLLSEFWRSVESGQPPRPRTAEDVKRMFPRSVASSIEATPQIASAVETIASIKVEEKRLEDTREQLEVAVKYHMGTSEALRYAGRTIATWKQSKGSERVDVIRLRAERPEIAAEFTLAGEGARRFLIK